MAQPQNDAGEEVYDYGKLVKGANINIRRSDGN